LKQEGPESPTRFSKTFDQEKKLDKILTSMKEEDNGEQESSSEKTADNRIKYETKL